MDQFAVARLSAQFTTRSRSRLWSFFFSPLDKDKEKQFDQCTIHFYLTLGGRLFLMRVDNMVSGFQRCWSAHHTEWLDSKLPPRRTAGGLAPAVRHPRFCSEKEISWWRGPLPCQQRGQQMTFVSLDVSSHHAVRVWSEFKFLADVPLNFSLTNRNDSTVRDAFQNRKCCTFCLLLKG